jgi:hypothetical protein
MGMEHWVLVVVVVLVERVSGASVAEIIWHRSAMVVGVFDAKQ